MKILIDSRDKRDFRYDFSIYGVEQEVKALKTGDYTLDGYEHLLTIDRKKSISELYGNFFMDYSRFRKELERLSVMKGYILCEFPYSQVIDFPLDMPRHVKPKYNAEDIINKIVKITDKYKVEFIFCNSREEAEQTCFNILKEFYEQFNTRTT